MSEWMRWGLFVILVAVCVYYYKWNEKVMPGIWHKIGLQERANKIKKIKNKIK